MIHRAEHKNDYIVVQMSILKDENLSWDAKGFLMFLLSFADDWKFNVRGLATLTGLCGDTVARLIDELKRAGYIELKKMRTKGKFQSVEWNIYEEPRSVNTEHGNHRTRFSSNTEFTEQGESRTINQYQSITSINNNQYQKRNKSVDEFSKILEPLPSEIRDVFKEFIAMRKKVKAPLTSHALELAIKRAYELGGNNTERIVAVVNQSIMNSWKGLFELKEEKVQPITQQPKYGFDPNEALAWAREQDRKKAEGNL